MAMLDCHVKGINDGKTDEPWTSICVATGMEWEQKNTLEKTVYFMGFIEWGSFTKNNQCSNPIYSNTTI